MALKKNICDGPLAHPVDPSDDIQMVSCKIRQPRFLIDRREFIHSAFEKKELALRRNKYSPKLDHYKPDTSYPGKLVMYFENSLKDNFFHTTESTICQEREILSIVAEYVSAKKTPVKKVTYKGKIIKI